MSKQNHTRHDKSNGRTALIDPPALKMLRHLYPKMYVPSIEQIDQDILINTGIRCVLFDLDNTLVPRDEDALTPQAAEWIREISAKGVKVCVVSNCHKLRYSKVTGAENIPAVCRAIKPLKRSFRRAMKMLEVTEKETAIVGDQIFTDILGGNRMNLFTILVDPLPGKEFWATKLFSRRLERIILSGIIRRQARLGRSMRK